MTTIAFSVPGWVIIIAFFLYFANLIANIVVQNFKKRRAELNKENSRLVLELTKLKSSINTVTVQYDPVSGTANTTGYASKDQK